MKTDITNAKLKYLNAGCGTKFHTDWVNIDINSSSPHVRSFNFLNGLPYENNYFDVVYHSQVLEHFPKDKAPHFLSECFRVLKPNGVIRIVVPDLENIAREYIKHLEANISSPTPETVANYDWIMLEMYDQTVRNHSGGQMAEFLKLPNLPNKEYIIHRIGYVAKDLIPSVKCSHSPALYAGHTPKSPGLNYGILIGRLKNKLVRIFNIFRADGLREPIASENSRIGSFRLSGEVHMWMYDRFSLGRLLREVGFDDIKVLDPHRSAIPNWSKYELDVRDGAVFDPSSLFIEARKSV
jgi:predicted SAM-dependent methyltransferase